MDGPKMGIAKAGKLGVRSKILLFSKTVRDNRNRSADICLVMQAVGQPGHSLSMCILRSLWPKVLIKDWQNLVSAKQLFGTRLEISLADVDDNRIIVGRFRPSNPIIGDGWLSTRETPPTAEIPAPWFDLLGLVYFCVRLSLRPDWQPPPTTTPSEIVARKNHITTCP